MGEVGAGLSVDVFFDLMPVVFVVADALAIHANGNQFLQLADIGERLLQIDHFFGEGPLQLHHALAHLEAGAEFIGVKRLDDVVVRPGVQTGGNFFLLALGREEQKVKVGAFLVGAHPAANFQPVELGHHPVNDGNGRWIFPLKDAQRLFSILSA